MEFQRTIHHRAGNALTGNGAAPIDVRWDDRLLASPILTCRCRDTPRHGHERQCTRAKPPE